MYPILLTAAGALLLIYSLYICKSLIPLIKWPYMRIPWKLSILVMLIFLTGYVLYLRTLFLTAGRPLSELWAGIILFSGALFITILIEASYELIDWLAANEAEFTSKRSSQEFGQEALDRQRKIIELKMVELQKALEAVYTLRNKIEKGRIKNPKTIDKRLNKIGVSLPK